MVFLKRDEKNGDRFCHVRRSFLVLLIAAVFTGIFQAAVVSAQTKVLIRDQKFTVDARDAIDSLYNRNNEAAEDLLDPWRTLYPDHPLWLLWDGMEVWWEVLEDLNDHSLDREFIARMQQADYEAAQVLRSEPGHPDALIIRAVANGYIARIHANREDWLTSVQVARRAYQAHQQLMEVAPELPDNHFAEGMKLYYSAYIPEAYPVVKAVSWFFPEGSREKGLGRLRIAIEEGVFARAEARYFLGNILLNYEHDYDEAKDQFRQLVEHYPNNSYYRCQYLRTLDQLKQDSEILAFAEETLEHWQTHNLPENPVLETELNYWMGRAHYNRGEWYTALPFFRKSVDLGDELVNNEARDVYVLSAYFAGRTLESLNQDDEARRYYKIAADQKNLPEARRQSRERLKML